MSKNDQNTASVGQTGSADDLIKNSPSPNDGTGGELDKTKVSSDQGDKTDKGNVDDVARIKKENEEANKKIGEQGEELGEYRNFFKEVSPLLDKLQAQPELVEAIMEGKIDASLAQAVIDNKVKIEDAADITKAHEEVKKDLGKKEYEKTSAEDIERMISEKVAEVSKNLEETQKSLKNDIKTSEERRKFEGSVEEFIAKTDDFSEYSAEINDWLEDHPNVYDIETAYYAVKGKTLATKKAEDDDASRAEAAKTLAANAAGGGSQGAKIVTDENVADSLIADSSNPNTF